MATFTITALNTNIDSLAGKAGGDIYNINGGQLVIDQDSRYGLNQSTSTSLAAQTISATLGGEIHVDATTVRLIPYNTGTGNVPVSNTVISQGGVSAKLIGVWGSLTAAPTASGAAMPATGFIKVKQKAGGNYAAGALTGISASATGADTAGWLDIVGDEAATCTVPRLGTYRVTGDWYELGTTNATANQQFQIPSSGLTTYIPGVFIEKVAGGGDYEFYPDAGSQTTVATDIRAKVVWIDTAGLVRIGHNGTANAGYVPVTGLKVVIPNIIFHNCTTAARTANALPNATLATRYDFTTTGGGVIDIDKAMFGWYMSFSQAFSVNCTNSATLEQISISEIASPMTLDTFGVGQTAARSQVALLVSLCFAGITMSDCHFSSAKLVSSGFYTATITDCELITATNVTFTGLALKGSATTGNVLATRMNNSTWTNTELINGRFVQATCSNNTITNSSYADVITGTTNTTAVQNSHAFEISTNSSNITISGIDFLGLTNVQPYLGLFHIAAAGNKAIRLRNVGTRASPLSLGSTNGGAYLVQFATSAAANDVKIQRCYVSNTRTGIWTADNSNTRVVFENVAGDYADAPVVPMLNTSVKGVASTTSLTAQTACYGTHWFDIFTATTTGRIGLFMNEATTLTASQIALANGARFTSAGGLYMPTIGMEAIFEMPYYALGHTAFPNNAAVMAGGTIGNYTLDYQIDKNDGNGFSAYKTLNGTNLSGETGIDAALGVKLKIRITTSTTNATAITSLYVLTTSTAAAQDNQYPLDTVAVKVNAKDATTLAAIEGARVYLTATGGGPSPDGTVLLTGLTDASGYLENTSFAYLGSQTISGRVRKSTSAPYYKTGTVTGTITSNGLDITILLIPDE